MKSFPGVRNRCCQDSCDGRGGTGTAAGGARGSCLGQPRPGRGGTARTAADTTACPWLNQSLPVQQRVSMLMAQMTLADKINMVTGAGTSQPYVF